MGRADICPKVDSPYLKSGVKSFYITDGGRWVHAEIAQSALMAILKLVISDLTSIILIVLSTVNLQFQGQSVSIFLRPILSTVTAMSCLQSGHHVVNFLHLGGFSIYKTASKIWLRILSLALKKELKVPDYGY